MLISVEMAVEIGDVIAGKYVLCELIGEGGMGVVFRGEHRALARTVAIKILHPKHTWNDHVIRRFLAEAVAASRLRHPHSVAMLDCNFLDDGRPYFVMEYVRGRPLRRIIADEHVPLPRALAIMDQILDALEAIHTHRVVHADITSDNFLVEQRDDGDHVTLIGFGLARMIDTVPDGIRVSGAPDYTAPEVVRGAPPTPASDLYAAGVVLYELLTGSTPYRGRGPIDVKAPHLEELIVPPSRRRPDGEIRSAFDHVVLKALDKRPEARFADAASFARALDAATREIPLRARMARGTSPVEVGLELRRAIGEALVLGDVARIAEGYARLAQELLRVRRVHDAIRELREGIDVVTHGHGPSAPDAPPVVNRLVAALAALHAPERSA